MKNVRHLVGSGYLLASLGVLGLLLVTSGCCRRGMVKKHMMIKRLMMAKHGGAVVAFMRRQAYPRSRNSATSAGSGCRCRVLA